MTITRRDFLKTATGIMIAGPAAILPALPAEAKAIINMDDFWSKDRWIDCRRADTGERRQIQFYRSDAGYDGSAYRNVCWLLRDAKDQNTMIGVDVGLLNLIYAMQEWARLSGRPDPVITVNSAYRTPRRNATIEGAAKNSMHTYGKAIDFTMRGVDLYQLQQMAKYYSVGGVGIYDSFIHLDTGRVRSWRG